VLREREREKREREREREKKKREREREREREFRRVKRITCKKIVDEKTNKKDRGSRKSSHAVSVT
jgi:hypothetical protein